MMDASVVPGELGVRSALRSRLLRDHVYQVDTVLIDELGLCRGLVRVDVVVVNGSLHGFEIKSDRDRLRRLSTQAEIYGKVLDQATLVVGDRHLADATDVVPAWWGILRFYPTAHGLRFKTVRHPRKNPHRDSRALVELLWLDEAIALLEGRNAARGVRGKARGIVWDRVCDLYDIDEIASAVRTNLKARARKQFPA